MEKLAVAGAAAVPVCAAKTAWLLDVVVAPMLLISARIDWYSWFAAPYCEAFSVPLPASVASVTARLSRLLTCEGAPSAVCSRPTPRLTLLADWVSADWLACRPLASERPAASSAPELMREPEESCVSTFCRLVCVLLRLFAA